MRSRGSPLARGRYRGHRQRVTDPLGTAAKFASVAATVKKLFDGDNATADREFAEQRDGIVVENAQNIAALAAEQGVIRGELAAIAEQLREFSKLITSAFPQWEAEPADESPTAHDVIEALRRYAGDYQRAGSHAKRKLLFSALVGEFNPEFYRDGWNRIFGDIARRLEPPHIAELRELLNNRRQSSIQRNARNSSWPLIRDLEREGMIRTAGAGESARVWVGDPARRFLEFLWDYDEQD